MPVTRKAEPAGFAAGTWSQRNYGGWLLPPSLLSAVVALPPQPRPGACEDTRKGAGSPVPANSSLVAKQYGPQL